MTWARLDDAFPDHPKVEGLSDAAFRLHVAGICHAARYLTDGLIPLARVPRLVPAYKPKALSELLLGPWHPDGHLCTDCAQPGVGSVVVHDFLAFNKSRAMVLEERAAGAERQRRARSRRDTSGSNGVTTHATNTVSHSDPALPGPTPVVDPSAALTTSPDLLAAAAGIIGERASRRRGVQAPSAVRLAVAKGISTTRARDAYVWQAEHPDGTAQQLADHLEPPEHPPTFVLPPTSAPEAIADFEPPAPDQIEPDTREQGLASVRALRTGPT